MMVWEYFTHFHKSAQCYTDVHVYRATSLDNKLLVIQGVQIHLVVPGFSQSAGS